MQTLLIGLCVIDVAGIGFLFYLKHKVNELL